MTLNELNIIEKSHYYKDSDIFHLKPPKSPEKFKFKRISLNFENNDKDNYQINLSKDKYYINKKDHINDILKDKNWMTKYISRFKKYKTVGNLKKESKRLQLDKSYDYNYGENNKIYKNIRLHHIKGNVSFGNSISNFSSEYNSMQDYARKIMLKKRLEKEKTNMLNKSMDIPLKFKPLKRLNFKRKNYLNDLFTPNTIDIDLTRSTDSIKLIKYKNDGNNYTIDYYKSNIFFDKEKAIFRDGNFPLPYANYKPHKELIISSIDNIYNSKNKKLYYGLTEMERNTDKYIVLGISKNSKFDAREIKKIFAKSGIHMFGEQTYTSYIENGQKGKFVFNIRRDVKDLDHNEKMKKIQDVLFKKQGITINLDNRKMNYNKKKRNDITPTIPNKRDDEFF